MSSSEDEENIDQLLRLADPQLRKKLGLNVETQGEELKRVETETERRTASLRKAHRKVQQRVGERTKQDKRLEATKNALRAQENSVSLQEDAPSVKETEESPKVTKTELQFLLQTFKRAPKQVQMAFIKGQKKFTQKKWKEATDHWSSIVEMEEFPTELQWMGDVHGRMGVAFLRQGLIQKALSCFQQVVLHAEERQYREELVIDVLTNLSTAYREIGEMDRAMETGDEAKKRLKALVGCEDDTIDQVISMDKVLFNAVDGNYSAFEKLIQDTERQMEVTHFVDSKTGVSFLLAAAGQGNVAFLQKLLQIDPRILELRDIRGHTALAWACKFGHADSVTFLLEKGAQFTTLDTAEIKTWPESSLRALQFHLDTLKMKTQPPPAPVSKKQVWDKPIRPGEVTEGTITTVVKNTLPAGFHAAPVSDDAKSGKLVGRALARWDDSDAAPLPSGFKENETGGKDWDQFEANKRLFGVKSKFEEDKYTTKLTEVTKQQMEDAERLAKEIESMKLAGDDGEEEDEEAKYGAVLGTGAYATSKIDSSNDGFTDAAVLKK